MRAIGRAGQDERVVAERPAGGLAHRVLGIPAVDHVVDPVEVATLTPRGGILAARTGIARLVERPESMVNRGLVGGKERAGGVIVDLQPPGHDRPLQGVVAGPDALVAGHGQVLVGAVRNRAVIDDHVAGRGAHRHRVVPVGRGADSAAHAQEPDDEVRAADRELPPADPDAAARRGLPGHRDVALRDAEIAAEHDPAAHVEHHRAIALTDAVAQ